MFDIKGYADLAMWLHSLADDGIVKEGIEKDAAHVFELWTKRFIEADKVKPPQADPFGFPPGKQPVLPGIPPVDEQSIAAVMERMTANAKPPEENTETPNPKYCPNYAGYGVRKPHGQASPPHSQPVEGRWRESSYGGFFSCPDRECLRPGGKGTTWEAGSHKTRITEFQTGQTPQRRQYGR